MLSCLFCHYYCATSETLTCFFCAFLSRKLTSLWYFSHLRNIGLTCSSWTYFTISFWPQRSYSPFRLLCRPSGPPARLLRNHPTPHRTIRRTSLGLPPFATERARITPGPTHASRRQNWIWGLVGSLLWYLFVYDGLSSWEPWSVVLGASRVQVLSSRGYVSQIGW